MEKKIRDSFLSDSAKYLIGNILSGLLVFITLPIYTRFLSPAEYGIFGLFLLFGSISSGVISFGIHLATYKFYFQYVNELNRYKIINSTNIIFLFGVYFFGGMIIYFCAEWFSLIFFDSELSKKVISLSFLSGCLQYIFTYCTLILNAQKKSTAFSLITVTHASIKASISIFLIFKYQMTYFALIYGLIFTNALFDIILIFYVLRDLFTVKFSFKELKKSIKFSYPTTPRLIIDLLYSSFDKFLLNKYSGLGSIAHYHFGQKFAWILQMIMTGIGRSFSPFFLENAELNTESSVRLIVDRFYKILFFIMVCGIALIYFSEELIRILVTKEYYPSMFITPVFIYYHLFGAIGMITISQLMVGEKLIYRLPVTIFSLISNVILNLVLIPRYGAIGAVISTTFTSMISQIIFLFFGQKAFYLPLNTLRLFCLYFILLILTIPVYPLINMEINFLLKIFVKLSIITFFILSGIFFKFIKLTDIKFIFQSTKLIFAKKY